MRNRKERLRTRRNNYTQLRSKMAEVICFLVNVKMKLNMQNWYLYAYQKALFGHFSVCPCNVICKNVLWI